jgi:hypothetical protein
MIEIYLGILDIYKNIDIKEFRAIVDTFFYYNGVLESFIQFNEKVELRNGKIMLKNRNQEKQNKGLKRFVKE